MSSDNAKQSSSTSSSRGGNGKKDTPGHTHRGNSPASGKTARKIIDKKKRKLSEVAPLPSLNKVVPSKKSKPKATAVSGGNKRIKEKKLTENEKMVKIMSDLLIRKCAHISSDAQRKRRRLEAKKELKRRFLTLTSERFTELWTKARKRLDEATEEFKEASKKNDGRVETGESQEPRIPKKVPKAAVGKTSSISIQQDEERKPKQAVEAEKKVQGSPQRDMVTIVELSSGSESSVEAMESEAEPELEPQPIPEPDIPNSEKIRWSYLMVGSQYRGETYAFGEWDSVQYVS